MFDLEKFKRELQNQVDSGKLSKETKTTYISCIRTLNKTLAGTELTSEKLLTAVIGICGDKSQGAKYIAAIKKYERDVLQRPKSLIYGEELRVAREKYCQTKIAKELKLPEKTYLKKVNRLENEKLKLALRLQERSGLRIAEVADLNKVDIFFLEDYTLKINVRRGKGGKQREVCSMQDKYLYEKLKVYVESMEGQDKIFYSKSYLKKKACELGIPTHDMRRLNARERFRVGCENGLGKRDARKIVQKELGHKDGKITNAYLGADWLEED